MRTLALRLGAERRTARRASATAPEASPASGTGAPRCAACGRPLPPRAVEDGDGFCSAACCKRAHGVRETADTDALPEVARRGRRGPGRIREGAS